ncbi:MAG: short chain dehydrogenase [Burkholderiales bacterium]|nr:short chain dehydrogenase [Burkholderiales bacterium]
MMRIVVIGGTGTIGRSVVTDFASEHEVISVGRTPNPDSVTVNMSQPESIGKMFGQIGKVDAIITTAGGVTFKPIDELDSQDVLNSLNDKLMGQINLVLIGKKYLNKGGSFTLTSGILSNRAIASGICASTVNGAINSFVQATACELIKHNIRINAVSPTVLKESYDNYFPYFSGFYPVSSKKVAYAYRMSVTGIETGRIFEVV